MRRRTARDRYLTAIAQSQKYKQKKGSTMSKKLKFPDVSDRDDRISEIRTLMAQVYDEAVAEKTRRDRMGATPTVDSKRFPVMKGGN